MWDADRQNPNAVVENQYPNSSVDIYPFAEREPGTAEFHRPGTSLSKQPGVSLPARAVGNQITPTGNRNGGAALTAAGPGSLTFHLPADQNVIASGAWKDERWSVLLSRPLQVAGAQQLNLRPGERISVAFAIWDGSQRDRNGQKVFSIWQDLVLEASR
jgi:complex iron-sulfur molybdoenzyme family reductase subunit gamma